MSLKESRLNQESENIKNSKTEVHIVDGESP